jgi:predicted ATP-dependent Lon-type protease
MILDLDSNVGDMEMDEFIEMEDSRAVIKNKLRQTFDGRIVRKDLTKHIKEGANVPVYVLEFLLPEEWSKYLLPNRK